MVTPLLNILIYAGIALLALIVIGVILTRLYRRATKDVALIRTGFGGEKVVLNGGIMVIPVLHELMQVRLTTVKLEVSRLNKDALITLDKLRVDVVGLFHIKVKPDAESIAAAAQTLGDSVNSPDAVKSLLDGKLVSALRSVAATMTMEHLHANRADFIQKVQEALMTDLDMNGFQLESVSITHFDQTAFEHFNENNAFDAEGLTVLTRTIEERKKIRNDIVATNRVEIEQRNLDANNQSLEIAQAAEQARLTQEQTLAARRAEQATAIATAEAEQTRLAEIARISAVQAQTVAQTEADLASPATPNVPRAIMQQKYIAMFLNPDSWTDMRRYDFSPDIYPNLVYPAGASADAGEPDERNKVTVEVGGRRLEVVLPSGLASVGGGATGAKKPKRSAGKKAGAAASGDSVTSPMQGTIVKVAVEEGATVAEGDVIVVLEAMKMEQPIKAHKAGTVTGLKAEVGTGVTNGEVVCEIKSEE